MIVLKKYKAYALTLLMSTTSYAHVFMNVLRPHERLIKAERTCNKCFSMTTLIEHGIKAKGYTEDGEQVSVFRAWNADQSSLAMLEGFPPESALGVLAAKLKDLDDGTRGHFDVCGELKMDYLLGLGFQMQLPHNFSVGLSVPFYGFSLKDVTWTDKTLNVTSEDIRIKECLTNDVFARTRQLGGLSLEEWRRSGVGDITLLAMWMQDFQQEKPFLKNVRLDARVGFNIPTGRRVDEDVILSVPFGYDGALGLIWGVGLEAMLGCHFLAGVDVELMHLFGNTRNRRIKTQMNQTELMLLAKARTHKDWGLTQRFNLYITGYHLLGGLSLTTQYQFLKRGDDTVSLCTNEFSSPEANSAFHVQEREVQSIIFDVSYDWRVHMDECSRIIPRASFFYRMPFKGSNVVATHSFGFGLGIDF